VESLDDLGDSEPTGNAQILGELAEFFEDSGYDLRELWRTLALTRAYGLSSQGEDANVEPGLFASIQSKPLTPEQLYDSFVLLSPTHLQPQGAAAANDMASSLDEDPARMDFVRRMRPPPGDASQYRAGTLQALMLMNGRVAAGVSDRDGSNLLGALSAPGMTDEERVESLFLATLARAPDADERQVCLAALAEQKSADDRDRALSDVLWALVNSTEFAFNH
jgi:hypothetical protein